MSTAQNYLIVAHFYSLHIMSISTYSFHEIEPSQTSATTDEKLITMWLHGKSQTSQKTYTSTVKQFLAFVGKGLRDLKLEDVQMWSSSLELRYSATTVKNKVNAVKSLLSFGQKIGYLQFNIDTAITT